MGGHNGTSGFKPLEQNCRPDWPLWTCNVGNVCGLCSTALWFIVLLPQVWKNFRRKSVMGLSVLWATANFTASIVNLFFVFMYASIPLYGQISSVYSPVLEGCLMIQFWAYGHYRMLHKVLYLCACVVAWGAVIAVELLLDVQGTVEYVAIALWCVETFPQVILNMKLKTTSGQSRGSVIIAMVGKTTDFITNNVLVLPLQYVIMVYFSTSVAYVNGLQVAWYYGNDLQSQPMEDADTGEKGQTGQSESSKIGQSRNSMTGQSQDSLVTTGSGSKFLARLGFKRLNAKADKARVSVLCLLSVFLVTCVVGFVWNTHSLYGLFAPVAIALVLLTARLYFWKCSRGHYSLQ